jgi:predicted dehydrogenase
MSASHVNWAIVGLGDIVRKRVGPALLEQPQSRIYACVTRQPKRRADELASLQPERVYANAELMWADPQVDAVYIATPTYLHAPLAIAALQSGKHVLVEKPMAMRAGEGERIIEAADQGGRRLAVAYYRRFWPTFRRVKDMLDRGELGQVTSIRAALHSWYAPPLEDGTAWRVQPELSGGGVLSDVGCHRLDLLAWWFGMPRRVAAMMGTRTHAYAAEDSAAALLSFGDGIPCNVSFQWNSKTWADQLHIVGSEASIALPVLDGDEMIVTRGRDTESLKFARHVNAHYDLIDDFAAAMVEGRAPRFDGADGLAATRMIDLIVESAARGSWTEAAS